MHDHSPLRRWLAPAALSPETPTGGWASAPSAPSPALPIARDAAVDLYWIPLGADGWVVRLNGKVYEFLRALVERRRRLALYHCALQVSLPGEGRFSIELAPIPDGDGVARGVVCEGPVGYRWLGRFRLFRYELRCSRDHDIPDVAEAAGGPRRLTEDPGLARRLLDAMPSVPALTWGRDELRLGEMWNSNSVVAWLLARSGVPLESVGPPPGGRAPGWDAGLALARRRSCSGCSAPSRGQMGATGRGVLAWLSTR